jgi:hypothetical protein
MSLKTRIRKLERIAPAPLPDKRPEDMTDAELDAAIEYNLELARRTPEGREWLARLDAVGAGKSEEEALRARVEFLGADLARSDV